MEYGMGSGMRKLDFEILLSKGRRAIMPVNFSVKFTEAGTFNG
jgi:hypothetical protein